MKLAAALLTLVTTLVLPCTIAQDNDAAKLQGTWVLASVEIEGKEVPLDNLHESRLVIKDDNYSFSLKDLRLEFQYKLDATASPKAIDLKVTQGSETGMVYHGIYTLEEGRYKICRNTKPQQPRPTTFATEPDSGLMMVVWKRE